MNWFVLLYLCRLKATNTDKAIGKYPIDRTPFLLDKKYQLLWRNQKWSNNHNTATTESSTSTFAAIKINNKKLYIILSLLISPRELTQIPPTVCVIISKIALKQDFVQFSVEHCQNNVVADKNIVYYNLDIEYWKGSPDVKLEAVKIRTVETFNQKIRNQWSMKNVIDTPTCQSSSEWTLFTNKDGVVP